jgi:hypothetical protein
LAGIGGFVRVADLAAFGDFAGGLDSVDVDDALDPAGFVDFAGVVVLVGLVALVGFVGLGAMLLHELEVAAEHRGWRIAAPSFPPPV